ncbi:hypothetical protein V3C99_017869 [Haemonchus contortus]|uniref:Reverse transcriptase domain-containing protein n=1 Tax=Haemonchus contortus TaxID=6289 RepID=A0A7I4Z673_HAECO
MLQLDWDDKGINIDGRKLSNLRFADDIVLISQNREELQQMVEELDDVSKAIGLTMNRSKTMVMRNEWADASPITLEGTTLPFTDSYVYLGRLISMDNNLRAEIMRRRRCAWAAIGNIKEAAHLVSDKKVRADLFDSTVLPVLCYASETWAENKTSTLMLVRAQRALERTLLKINRAKQRSSTSAAQTCAQCPASVTSKCTRGTQRNDGQGTWLDARTTGGPLASRSGTHVRLNAHLAVLQRDGVIH